MVEQVFHVDDWETIANQSSEYGYCIVKPEKNGRSKKDFAPVKTKKSRLKKKEIFLYRLGRFH